MGAINLNFGETVDIPFTIAGVITGKTVVFVIARQKGGARIVRKTSASALELTVSQSTPTGIGAIKIVEADFANGELADGIAYDYSLWYQEADGSVGRHVASGVLTVAGTVARTA